MSVLITLETFDMAMIICFCLFSFGHKSYLIQPSLDVGSFIIIIIMSVIYE